MEGPSGTEISPDGRGKSLSLPEMLHRTIRELSTALNAGLTIFLCLYVHLLIAVWPIIHEPSTWQEIKQHLQNISLHFARQSEHLEKEPYWTPTKRIEDDEPSRSPPKPGEIQQQETQDERAPGEHQVQRQTADLQEKNITAGDEKNALSSGEKAVAATVASSHSPVNADERKGEVWSCRPDVAVTAGLQIHERETQEHPSQILRETPSKAIASAFVAEEGPSDEVKRPPYVEMLPMTQPIPYGGTLSGPKKGPSTEETDGIDANEKLLEFKDEADKSSSPKEQKQGQLRTPLTAPVSYHSSQQNEDHGPPYTASPRKNISRLWRAPLNFILNSTKGLLGTLNSPTRGDEIGSAGTNLVEQDVGSEIACRPFDKENRDVKVDNEELPATQILADVAAGNSEAQAYSGDFNPLENVSPSRQQTLQPEIYGSTVPATQPVDSEQARSDLNHENLIAIKAEDVLEGRKEEYSRSPGNKPFQPGSFDGMDGPRGDIAATGGIQLSLGHSVHPTNDSDIAGHAPNPASSCAARIEDNDDANITASPSGYRMAFHKDVDIQMLTQGYGAMATQQTQDVHMDFLSLSPLTKQPTEPKELHRKAHAEEDGVAKGSAQQFHKRQVEGVSREDMDRKDTDLQRKRQRVVHEPDPLLSGMNINAVDEQQLSSVQESMDEIRRGKRRVTYESMSASHARTGHENTGNGLIPRGMNMLSVEKIEVSPTSDTQLPKSIIAAREKLKAIQLQKQRDRGQGYGMVDNPTTGKPTVHENISSVGLMREEEILETPRASHATPSGALLQDILVAPPVLCSRPLDTPINPLHGTSKAKPVPHLTAFHSSHPPTSMDKGKLMPLGQFVGMLKSSPGTKAKP